MSINLSIHANALHGSRPRGSFDPNKVELNQVPQRTADVNLKANENEQAQRTVADRATAKKQIQQESSNKNQIIEHYSGDSDSILEQNQSISAAFERVRISAAALNSQQAYVAQSGAVGQTARLHPEGQITFSGREAQIAYHTIGNQHLFNQYEMQLVGIDELI